MGTEIFRAGMNPPEDIDGLSAPPKGFKHYLDANGTDSLAGAKAIIVEKFPAVKNVQIFHETKSDMGGNMMIRFIYNNKPIELPVSYQELVNTFTNQRYSELSAHIQSLTPEARGIFNIILKHINKLEATTNQIKGQTRASLDNEIQTV